MRRNLHLPARNFRLPLVAQSLRASEPCIFLDLRTHQLCRPRAIIAS
jgi:hypothetical protein